MFFEKERTNSKYKLSARSYFCSICDLIIRLCCCFVAKSLFKMFKAIPLDDVNICPHYKHNLNV